MLVNGQFISSFVLTLCAFVVLVALIGIAFVAVLVWRLLQPFREWLEQSWVTSIIRATGTFLGAVIAHVKSFITGLLVALFVRPWQTFISLLTKYSNALGVALVICICVLPVCSLPFLVFATAGISLKSIFGVIAAGALIGLICAPFVGWHNRLSGLSKAIGASLLTIVGGAYGASMLIATLIAMGSD